MGGCLCGMGRSGWGGREKEVPCRTGDPQALAAQDDHIGWSFPFKPPLVNVSVGCLLCPSDELLRSDEYSCSVGKCHFPVILVCPLVSERERRQNRLAWTAGVCNGCALAHTNQTQLKES